MEDFNEYIKSKGIDAEKQMNSPEYQNIFNMVGDIASKFDGKNEIDLMRAIYNEAKRGKQNGTLSNSDIDAFASMLAPFIDDRKKKLLYKIAEELKKI